MKKKLKALIDTNIFISALLGGTTASMIIDSFISGAFLLTTSGILIKELRKTLRKPKIFSLVNEAESAELISFIRLKAEVVTPFKELHICRDAQDNCVLECALEAKPNVIVTMDKDILVLKAFHDIPIITSWEFISLLKK